MGCSRGEAQLQGTVKKTGEGGNPTNSDCFFAHLPLFFLFTFYFRGTRSKGPSTRAEEMHYSVYTRQRVDSGSRLGVVCAC